MSSSDVFLDVTPPLSQAEPLSFVPPLPPPELEGKRLSCSCARIFGLVIKATLLTAHRCLDLFTLWRVTWEEEAHSPFEFFAHLHWWGMVFGLVASTLLSAVALSRHRAAIRQNRRWGSKWATVLAVSQVAPLIEMVDKLGDGFLWGEVESELLLSKSSVFRSPLLSSPQEESNLNELKGSRYGENLMRGLRKLSITSFPSCLLSTSIHGMRLLEGLAAPAVDCDSICRLEIVAWSVGIVCLAMAFADVVLYVWVDDVFVRTHKKLVQVYYFTEILSREPIVLLFHMAMYPRYGWGAILTLWATDVFLNTFLLMFPTIRAWRRGLSGRHVFSQAVTALILSQILFVVDLAYFDPRDAFALMNNGFHVIKFVETLVMVELLFDQGAVDLPDGFIECQTVIVLILAVLAWVITPWCHRHTDNQLATVDLPRLSRLVPRGQDSRAIMAPMEREMSETASLPPWRRNSLAGFIPGSNIEGDHSLELGTVREPEHNDMRPLASELRDDSARRLDCLGDILEALVLLGYTQSVRNRPLLSRTMIVDVLWSLVLPWEGDYDDGTGGIVKITRPDSESSALRVESVTTSRRPSNASMTSSCSFVGEAFSENVCVAIVYHGTGIELTWSGQGRVTGLFDGRRIRFADQQRTVWSKLGAEPERTANGAAVGVEKTLEVAPAAEELLRLVLTQLLLALRWEPTLHNLELEEDGFEADRPPAVVDASVRPLLSFLIRYILASHDVVFLSDVYWSMWCLSKDPHDEANEMYERARLCLVRALQGRIQFWDGRRGTCLDRLPGPPPTSWPPPAPPMQEADVNFRRCALQLLTQQGAIWRQTVHLAKRAAASLGDAQEQTRVIQQQLSEWYATNQGFDVGRQDRNSDLLTTEDPFLAKLAAKAENEDHFVSVSNPNTFVSLPIDPGVRFHGLDIRNCRVLKSNAKPLLLSVLNKSCASDAEPRSALFGSHSPEDMPRKGTMSYCSEHDSKSFTASSHTPTYMVKVGDDLRRDQLVLQMMALMERVWKERLPGREHEMLRLAPYRVLAITPSAGYVKFVPGAVSLSTALHQSRGCLVAWLDAHRPRSLSLNEAMKNLCGSVAAYCAATYVLGIGDRHLDNLQITPTGMFFHIDFGFIFGEDPKPLAPRLRLPQAVASALHGVQIDGESSLTYLDHCIRLAGRAYVALRRSQPLWVSLLRVTGKAGGGGRSRLGVRTKAATNLVCERLRSDLGPQGEEIAAREFLTVLCESTQALYDMLTDNVHQMSIFWQ